MKQITPNVSSLALWVSWELRGVISSGGFKLSNESSALPQLEEHPIMLPKMGLIEETPSGSLTVDLQEPNGFRGHLNWEGGKGLLIFD